jgi:hypothetical protein
MRLLHGLKPSGLAIAFGVAWLALSPAARAQYSYGHDSFVGYPQSQAYWYSAGYAGVYTDPTTGVYASGTVAPYRGVAPYMQPPYGQMGSSNGLTVYGSPYAVTNAPPRPVAVQRRRGLLARLRGR